MKDMRARSGTNLQDFPTKLPPYLRHSFLLSWVQSRAVRLIALDWRETPQKSKISKIWNYYSMQGKGKFHPKSSKIDIFKVQHGKRGKLPVQSPKFVL